MSSQACQSLGNHELDNNVDGVVPFIQNISSPVLAANLILDKVPTMQNLTNLRNSIILTKSGVNIGIIGYLTPKTKSLAPANDIEYEDEIIAIRREVTNLKKQGVKIFIALGHSGYYKDMEIARNVEDLDLVIGGHSHTFLSNSNTTDEKPQGPYPTIETQSSGRKVLVVQAYRYTKYLGKLILVFDSEGEIIKHDGIPILLNHEIPRDQELLKTVEKYRVEFTRVANEPVGNSEVTLSGETCRLRECNLGNFITDSMLNYTRKVYKTKDVNIAIIQGGRIRASISRPKIPFTLTRNDWINVLPYSDSLNIVTVNGSILMQALEHSAAGWRLIDSPGQFLQYSGVEVTYDLERPSGARVVKAKAVCSTCMPNILSDIKDDLQYKLMMSEFLANKGDDFTMFENLPLEVVSYNEIDCVIDALKSGAVDTKVSGRITILNEDKVREGDMPSSGAIIYLNGIICLFYLMKLYL